MKEIEALYSKLRRIFNSQGIMMLPIHSLTRSKLRGKALEAGFNKFIDNDLDFW